MNPITREESLLDGQDLTPITRKEKFIKRIYDKTQEVPTPVTREEWFLNKAAEGTSPVQVEELNATENGTYSETGKAYSPVIVEVPAPTLITKTITENGTYNASEDNADGYSQVTASIPLGIKTITANGVYNASDDDLAGYSQVTVNVPYMEKKSASGDIASFSDGAGYPFLKVKANITPVQDLHGYDYPWVGGAGKNLLDATYPTSQSGGVTITNNNDGSCTLNGLATMDLYFKIGVNMEFPSAEYRLNGCPTGGGTSSFYLYTYPGYNADQGSGKTFTGTVESITIFVKAGYNCNNIVFKPMLRLASNGDDTFAPYSNICPISGFTGVNVTVSPTTTEGSGTVYPISWQDEAGIVYGGYIDLVSGVLTVTKVGIAEYNGETLPSAWISDRDRYVAGNTPTIGAQVVYDLATPQTYQLTPQQINTLIGQNNVWNNTNGQAEVEYFIPIE